MTQQHEEPKAPEQKAPKKPYVAPKLVHLGSVRELTASQPTGSIGDGVGPGKQFLM